MRYHLRNCCFPSFSNLARFVVRPSEIRYTHHLPVLDLYTLFRDPGLDRSFISTVPCCKHPSSDVVFEQFLVDDIDNSRNDLVDVLLAVNESCYIIWYMDSQVSIYIYIYICL